MDFTQLATTAAAPVKKEEPKAQAKKDEGKKTDAHQLGIEFTKE
jgi:hypothetical protein